MLFQPFSRLGNENSGIEGTGIGLTITKTIVNLPGLDGFEALVALTRKLPTMPVSTMCRWWRRRLRTSRAGGRAQATVGVSGHRDHGTI